MLTVERKVCICFYESIIKGILAGYGRLQLKRPTGHMINESADIHLDVQSDFWIFRPLEGRQLKGKDLIFEISNLTIFFVGEI